MPSTDSSKKLSPSPSTLTVKDIIYPSRGISVMSLNDQQGECAAPAATTTKNIPNSTDNSVDSNIETKHNNNRRSCSLSPDNIEKFYQQQVGSSFFNKNGTSSFTVVGNNNNHVIKKTSTTETSNTSMAAINATTNSRVAAQEYAATDTRRKPKTAPITVLTMNGTDVSSSTRDDTDMEKNKLRLLHSSSNNVISEGRGSAEDGGYIEIPFLGLDNTKVATSPIHNNNKNDLEGRSLSLSDMKQYLSSSADDMSLPPLTSGSSNAYCGAGGLHPSLPKVSLTPRQGLKLAHKRSNHSLPQHELVSPELPWLPRLPGISDTVERTSTHTTGDAMGFTEFGAFHLPMKDDKKIPEPQKNPTIAPTKETVSKSNESQSR